MGNKHPYVHLCGVPKDDCDGTFTKTSSGLGAAQKAHTLPREAFACMKRFLLRQGYVQVGQREFAPPDGGPVRVLTKQSRYGGRLRRGKEGTRRMPVLRGGGIAFMC
jgi:hypothetical protein